MTAAAIRFYASPAPGVPDHYLYLPPGVAGGSPEQLARLPVLVMVHGISRNAAEQVLRASQSSLAGMAIVAPLFERRAMGRYQLLGSGRAGVAADAALLALLDWLGRSGLDTGRINLFGFSGGAQFAHRFALFHADRVARLCVAGAGWYTMPDAGLPWPLGLGAAPQPANLPGMLALPTLVIAGRGDNLRTASLNQSPAIDALQGRHRVARAIAWTQAIANAARAHGVPSRARLALVPAHRHHFDSYADAGGLFAQLAAFLGATTASTAAPRGQRTRRRNRRLEPAGRTGKAPPGGGQAHAFHWGI